MYSLRNSLFKCSRNMFNKFGYFKLEILLGHSNFIFKLWIQGMELYNNYIFNWFNIKEMAANIQVLTKWKKNGSVVSTERCRKFRKTVWEEKKMVNI